MAIENTEVQELVNALEGTQKEIDDNVSISSRSYELLRNIQQSLLVNQESMIDAFKGLPADTLEQVNKAVVSHAQTGGGLSYINMLGGLKRAADSPFDSDLINEMSDYRTVGEWLNFYTNITEWTEMAKFEFNNIRIHYYIILQLGYELENKYKVEGPFTELITNFENSKFINELARYDPTRSYEQSRRGNISSSSSFSW